MFAKWVPFDIKLVQVEKSFLTAIFTFLSLQQITNSLLLTRNKQDFQFGSYRIGNNYQQLSRKF